MLPISISILACPSPPCAATNEASWSSVAARVSLNDTIQYGDVVLWSEKRRMHEFAKLCVRKSTGQAVKWGGEEDANEKRDRVACKRWWAEYSQRKGVRRSHISNTVSEAGLSRLINSTSTIGQQGHEGLHHRSATRLCRKARHEDETDFCCVIADAGGVPLRAKWLPAYPTWSLSRTRGLVPVPSSLLARSC